MAPPTQPVPHAPQPDQGDATGGVIPYKNPTALVAYYCGVFAIIPFFPIGLTGLVLGILGLRARRRNPLVRGAVHAWIGIAVGGLFGLIWLALTVLIIIVAAVDMRNP
jgi:hypothetical protein